MPSANLNQAHKLAREALDATGCIWKISGKRMAYSGTMTLPDGTPLRAEGKSQLDTMRALFAEFSSRQNKAA